MNLLIITNNPDRASFRQRIEVYLDTLKASGIDCEVARLPEGALERRRLFKRAKDYDGVLLHKKKLNYLDALWLKKCAKKIIYNFDDAIMYSDKKPQIDSRAHYVPFRRTVKIADLVIAGSTYLAEHARKYNSNVEIVPIGLKYDDYQPHNPEQGDGKIRLVWVGSKSTLGYLEEIKPAIEQVGKRFNNVVLRIIGDDFFELKNIVVEKCIWSAETRSTDLAGGDIGLAPLPDNRFTRGKCSFKVLEYSASALPVVASPVGTNAEYVKDTITGFLVSGINQWIERISQLVEYPDLRTKMGRQGRAFAQSFDTDVIGTQLSQILIKELSRL